MKTLITEIRNFFHKEEHTIRPDPYDSDQQLLIYYGVILTNPVTVFQTLFNLDKEATITSFNIKDTSGKYTITEDYFNYNIQIKKITSDNSMAEPLSLMECSELFQNKPLTIIVKVDNHN